MGFLRPNKIATAKELANLRPGGKKPGAGRPKKTPASEQGKAFAIRVVNDPLYRRGVLNRARRGTLQPGVEALLIQLAWGKPKDTLEVHQPVPVQIVHQFAVAQKVKELQESQPEQEGPPEEVMEGEEA